MNGGALALMCVGITMIIISQIFGWVGRMDQQELLRSCIEDNVIVINEVKFSCDT